MFGSRLYLRTMPPQAGDIPLAIEGPAVFGMRSLRSRIMLEGRLRQV